MFGVQATKGGGNLPSPHDSVPIQGLPSFTKRFSTHLHYSTVLCRVCKEAPGGALAPTLHGVLEETKVLEFYH